MEQLMLSLPTHCHECGVPLGHTIYTMVWYEVIYEFCKHTCKTTWQMKAIAAYNLKHAGAIDGTH